MNATALATHGDVHVELGDDFVACAEFRRPPDNFFDRALIASLADALEALDQEPRCRAVLLCAQGKNFCAGADFRGTPLAVENGRHLYDEAVRLFRTRKPIVAAVQGAAVGGGLGVAMAADLRVGAAESRFSANFARLGFHHGFGLSVTLPAAVGAQRALELLYTGRRVTGTEAHQIGLCDRLVPADQLREQARALAAEIAGSGPLAVEAIRATMRGELAERIERAAAHERAEQERLQRSADFREGVRAMAERRPPQFKGS